MAIISCLGWNIGTVWTHLDLQRIDHTIYLNTQHKLYVSR